MSPLENPRLWIGFLNRPGSGQPAECRTRPPKTILHSIGSWRFRKSSSAPCLSFSRKGRARPKDSTKAPTTPNGKRVTDSQVRISEKRPRRDAQLKFEIQITAGRRY